MRQKTIVGLIMAAGAALMIAVGGWVMALIVLVLICFGVQEEFHALAQAGHRPVAWPTWVGMIVSIPLTLLIGTKMILPVIMAICLMTMICVIFRSEPKLDDAVLSMLPMLTVALPGMSAISFTHIEPKALQVTLITLMIGIPCMADAFAMWVGKAVKGPKLCPTVSPNKTISGAIGGVVGALLTSILIGVVAYLVAGDARPLLPAWYVYLILGILGGVVGKCDLFFSLVKRHCGMKDFSNLFPGHGGMLDRLDSVLFMAVLLLCYRLMAGI
ncbi:MAG: phosphatidate cytidylyltransferase [Christensenellales bacterium]